MDVVIIGAGQAGAWVARSLREAGHEGGITLLGREPHAPYERPPLSKAVLSGATRQELLELAGVVVVMQGGPGYVSVPKLVEALDALGV